MKWSVLIDVDEVLNNLMAETIEEANVNISLEIFTEYEIGKCVTKDVSKAFDAIWENKEFWDSLAPVEGAAAALRKLIQKDIDIYIMTACTPDIVEGRSKWLAKHFPFIKQCNIIYGHPKWLMGCDFIIEDRLETLLKTPLWTHRVLIDKPWNRQGAEIDTVHSIIRCNCIGEAVDMILEIVEGERAWEE